MSPWSQIAAEPDTVWMEVVSHGVGWDSPNKRSKFTVCNHRDCIVLFHILSNESDGAVSIGRGLKETSLSVWKDRHTVCPVFRLCDQLLIKDLYRTTTSWWWWLVSVAYSCCLCVCVCVCGVQVSVQSGRDAAVPPDHAPGTQQDARRRD